jgi:hypothetical protein
MNEVKVLVKEKYGNILFYPHNLTAQLFCDMLQTKTLTKTHLKFVKALGFTVDQSYEEVEI